MLSIIIPNLHSPRIGEVIAALHRQTALADIHEIIVVGMDRHGLVASGGRVRMLATEQPTAAATARNIGAAAARGQLLLFLDADCILAPDAVERLLAARVEGYGAWIGGVVLETKHYWELCNNLMTFPHNTMLDAAGERPTLASFCLMMPREVWAQVDGFDERFTVACEDMDLSFRLRHAGYRLGFTPAAVYHRPNRTTPGDFYRNHVSYGWYWRHIRTMYAGELSFSPALWASSELGNLGAAVGVLIAIAFVLRLIVKRRAMWRFWYAIPGMVMLRLAWYDGFRQSLRHARAQTMARVGG